jgi:hypothetical protein
MMRASFKTSMNCCRVTDFVRGLDIEPSLSDGAWMTRDEHNNMDAW